MGLTDGTTVVFGSVSRTPPLHPAAQPRCSPHSCCFAPVQYDGTVAGFAGDNGAQKWSVSMGGSVSSSLSFSNNNVIAANTNGDVSNIMQGECCPRGCPSSRTQPTSNVSPCVCAHSSAVLWLLQRCPCGRTLSSGWALPLVCSSLASDIDSMSYVRLRVAARGITGT